MNLEVAISEELIDKVDEPVFHAFCQLIQKASMPQSIISNCQIEEHCSSEFHDATGIVVCDGNHGIPWNGALLRQISDADIGTLCSYVHVVACFGDMQLFSTTCSITCGKKLSVFNFF